MENYFKGLHQFELMVIYKFLTVGEQIKAGSVCRSFWGVRGIEGPNFVVIGRNMKPTFVNNITDVVIYYRCDDPSKYFWGLSSLKSAKRLHLYVRESEHTGFSEVYQIR